MSEYRNKEHWVNIANQFNLRKCMCHWTGGGDREQVRPFPTGVVRR